MVLSTLCYIQKNDQTLMLHRNKKENDVHEGRWTGLGGKFEQGESPEECVLREVREESGLEIVSPQMRGIMTFPKFKDNTDWLVFLFTANHYQGQLRDCSEGHLQWISNQELLNLNLWEGDKLFMSWLKQGHFFSAKFTYQNQQLTNHQVTYY